jgi:hypothetical protein
MAIIYDMERIKERQKLSAQGISYSIQRIDLLIISISGAGIYVCFETLKYLHDNNIDLHNLIKISGGVLLTGILVNFVSQFLGNKTNYYDYLYCEEIIESGDNPNKEQQNKIELLNNKSDRYNNWTVKLTNTSAVVMLIGLILLSVYFFFIF